MVAGSLYAANPPASLTKSGTTSATVLYDLSAFPIKVTSVDATSDLTTSTVTFKARAATGDSFQVRGAPAAGQTVITLTRVGTLASNDTVIVYGSGFDPYKETVLSVTSSPAQITVTPALATSLIAGDSRVFKVTTVYEMPLGSNEVNRTSEGPIVRTAGDSPLLIEVTGTAACKVSVTAKEDR